MTNQLREFLPMVARVFSRRVTQRAIHIGLAAAIVLYVVLGPPPARIQRRASGCFFNGGGLLANRVGGVAIDAAGMVSPPDKSVRIPLRDALRKYHATPPAELNQAVEMRMVSLRRLEEAAKASQKSAAEMLPDDIRFLAGLQRIQYVLVYPEEHDIVLAGPGEGWKIDEETNVVGVTTGRPVLRLEDLLIAFRTADTARKGGISCSIDPTAEGRQRLEALSAKRAGSGAPPMAAMKKALGPQQITLTGVPTDSHMARVLVSSDFHMKRLGMNLDPSPVKGLPSFIEMLKRDNNVQDHPTPRWWMACDYEPLGRSEDGLAFELRGRGVKCLAEDEVVDAEGRVTGTGAANSIAQKWADLMTEHFDELCVKEASFGDLRNVMDMCVVAALIAKEQLLAKADCQLPTLLGPTSKLGVMAMSPPKTVESLCSQVKRGDSVIVMSGGVLISSWQVADKTELRPAVAKIHEKARPAAATTQAWWNPAR
jgi:uncharacterized protein DUF1598